MSEQTFTLMELVEAHNATAKKYYLVEFENAEGDLSRSKVTFYDTWDLFLAHVVESTLEQFKYSISWHSVKFENSKFQFEPHDSENFSSSHIISSKLTPQEIKELMCALLAVEEEGDEEDQTYRADNDNSSFMDKVREQAKKLNIDLTWP